MDAFFALQVLFPARRTLEKQGFFFVRTNTVPIRYQYAVFWLPSGGLSFSFWSLLFFAFLVTRFSCNRARWLTEIRGMRKPSDFRKASQGAFFGLHMTGNRISKEEQKNLCQKKIHDGTSHKDSFIWAK
jgi:hypothetical protein